MKQLTITAILVLTVLLTAFSQTTTVQECKLPFFSEMIDGQVTNKVLEIFNPSELPIDASDLVVLQFINGNTTPILIQLSGFIAPKETFVLAHQNADPAILTNTNQVSNKLNFNGNDAIALVNTDMLPPDFNEFPVTANAFIDIIGEVGTNPGNSGWVVVNGSTKNHCMIRKEEVKKPQTNWAIARTQWTAHPATNVSNLQQHQSVCQRLIATVGFDITSSAFDEDYFNVNTGNNAIFLDIFVSGAHDDITIFVQSGASFTGCGPDFADGTDFNIVTDQIFVPASSGGEIVQVELNLVDDNNVEPDESLCMDLNCLSANQDCNVDMDFCCHELVIIDNDGTGINENTLSNVKIYPSLAENTLHIEGLKQDKESKVSISNMIGQLVIQEAQVKSQNDKTTLDISTLESGMYFVNVYSPKGLLTKKFIKQ